MAGDSWRAINFEYLKTKNKTKKNLYFDIDENFDTLIIINLQKSSKTPVNGFYVSSDNEPFLRFLIY